MRSYGRIGALVVAIALVILIGLPAMNVNVQAAECAFTISRVRPFGLPPGFNFVREGVTIWLNAGQTATFSTTASHPDADVELIIFESATTPSQTSPRLFDTWGWGSVSVDFTAPQGDSYHVVFASVTFSDRNPIGFPVTITFAASNLCGGTTPSSVPSLPANAVANWAGNPNSPSFDGRLNTSAADPFVAYCATGQLQVYSAAGVFQTQAALLDVQGLDPAGAVLDMGLGFAVARSNDQLVVAGPGDFRTEFGLSDCLSRGGS